MSGAYVAEVVRRRVSESAARRCGYCQTQEEVVGYALHIEHILPLAAGGTSNEENLWLAHCGVVGATFAAAWLRFNAPMF